VNRKIIYVNFAIIGILALGLIYLLFQNQKILESIVPINNLKNDTSELPQPTPTPSSTHPSASPKTMSLADTQIAILEHTNNTNRSTFKEFLSKEVSVTLYATDCCQPMTALEAIKQLDYINEGMPITFDQNNTTIVNLKAKNLQLTGTYMGISQTKEHMVTYKINSVTNLIESIQMSVSWKLYNQ